ncbi:MAG: hypothetical protein JWL83_1930 [Actinomycetia bacterium]|nr:hypothetical protein [Actinomycetes bacterium]
MPHTRSRREVVTAAAGAFAVVAVTALLVWMLRPGTPFVAGTGGIAHRQPRVTWLVVLSLAALAAVVAYARSARRWRGRVAIVTAVGVILVLIGIGAAGAAWPGGLMRHYVSLTPPSSINIPTTTPRATTTPTTAPGGTTTTAPGGTTTPTTAPTTSSSG